MKTNYLFLAEGYEIAEAMCPVDMMTRGGLQVKTVSITEEHLVHSSHGIGIMADLNWSEFLKETENQDIDGEGVLAFPGGMPGSINLSEKKELIEIARKHFDKGGITAAICAAPSILGVMGILKDKNAVCFPGFEEKLAGANVLDVPAVTDKNVTTGRGMGAATDFALELIRVLQGEDKAKEMAEKIVFHC